jgi:hypothetical protein
VVAAQRLVLNRVSRPQNRKIPGDRAREIFWGPMAYAMIGGIIVGTLLFLPALYVSWFRIKAPGHAANHNHESPIAPVLQTDPSADAGSHREMENAQASA